MTTENYHFKVGTLQCIAISDGTDVNTVENLIRDVPPELVRQATLDHGLSPTEITTYFNCLYIQTDGQRVLVDAGWGQGTGRRNGALLEGLQVEGIAPADINTVVITHTDFDHVAGLMTPDSRVVFTNADLILSKEAWDFWTDESILAKLPEPLTTFGRKTLPILRDQLKVVEPGIEFLPGFELISAPGHRPGHTALWITSTGEHLLHLADAVGHPLLMENPGWRWSYDTQPEQAERDRRRLLNLAVTRQAMIFGSHLPFPGVGRAIPQGVGWIWQPYSSLP